MTPHEPSNEITLSGNPPLKLSARNILWGVVSRLVVDNITAEVVLTLDGGQQMTSVITRDAAEALGLAVGSRACAVIKSTEVMIGAPGE